MNKVTLGGNVIKSKLQKVSPEQGNLEIMMVTHEQDLSVNKIIINKLYGKELEEYLLDEEFNIPRIIKNLVSRLYSNK